MAIIDKLREVEARYSQIEASLYDPSIASDRLAYAKLTKEYKALTPVIEKYREYESVRLQTEEAKQLSEISDDAELRELALSE